ncbi:hypothetical protein M9H61_13595 [Thalassospira sp. GO-4]|uniref:hypothetical protein n=1 Tax=Thalassospira sp. GO-4 TaxID=2946605 RepID=UPI0020249046|nr:hypothetical protein [Thalassospira sp. GO-4]URK16578.1 hypothetical protein M9H61_13595 [Thalassospira sp. GO-4]
MSRESDISRFYSILSQLENTLGGKRMLSRCSGRTGWPQRGVYFFFEDGEYRSDTSNQDLRVVRVGTHALKAGSKTTLWNRLSQHRGSSRTGGGNHRASIFRLIVGIALAHKEQESAPNNWGKGQTSNHDIRRAELLHEKKVSAVIAEMPFLWLPIEDKPGPDSLRGLIERNSIALLSNHQRTPINPPSKNWLGYSCDRERVKTSGLWNQNHVTEQYEPQFLQVFEKLVGEIKL